MIRHVELVADNRGGFTLQVGKTWRHRYDFARQVADHLPGSVAGEHLLKDTQGVLPAIVRANGGGYRYYEGTGGTAMPAVLGDRLSRYDRQNVSELVDIQLAGHAADGQGPIERSSAIRPPSSEDS